MNLPIKNGIITGFRIDVKTNIPQPIFKTNVQKTPKNLNLK